MDCQNVVAVTDREKCSSLLEEAVLLVRKTLNLECPLVPLSTLESPDPSTELYLVPFFEGATYERVRTLGKPVIGPSALIYLIKSEILLPRRLKKGQNLWSLALQGSTVCCSNIEQQTRDTLYQQVVCMGGNASSVLTSDVTHLVVDEVGSTKYRFAVKVGIPIMRKEWITALWDRNETAVAKNDESVMKEYACPPFRGCKICVTGLDVSMRGDVERLTVQNGGIYSGDLVMDSVTHLLADTPSGKKFEHATQWKIHVVRTAWFYESIKKGVYLDPEGYRTKPTASTATLPSDLSYRPVLEETRMSRDMSRDSGDKVGGVLTRLNSLDLDVTLNKDKGYLEGCRIYLAAGFTPTEQDQLKRIINNGGGTRLDAPSSRVTHILCKAGTTLKELETLQSSQAEGAEVVSVGWLVESMEKGELQPESRYTLLQDSEQTATPENPLPNIRTLAAATRQRATNEERSILDQYTGGAGGGDGGGGDGDVTKRGDVTTDTSSRIELTRSSTSLSTTAKSDLFKGYIFAISNNIPNKIARNVQQQIISNGGCCRSDIEIDFFVVDAFKSSPKDHPDRTHVTYMWIQRCIQACQILSLSSCILYSPCPVPADCHPLKGSVICYTQFSGYELAHVCKVIEVLGGTAQGVFTNKPISNKEKGMDCLRCTHLIYKNELNHSVLKEGNKIDAARKWGIPAVHVDWLYGCLSSLSLVDLAAFYATRPGKENGGVQALSRSKISNTTETAIKKLQAEYPAHTVEIRILQPEEGTLKCDKDGFVTPLKIQKTSRLKVDSVIEALDSPAPAADATPSSLHTLWKRNLSSAVRKTAPSSRLLSGVTLVLKQRQPEVAAVELKALARKNGAVVKPYIDRTCTHIICGSKDTKDSRIEQAMKKGVKAVSCYWLVASNDQGTRLPEADYPPGYDPKRTLNLSVSEDVTVEGVEIDNSELLEPAPDLPLPGPSSPQPAGEEKKEGKEEEEEQFSLDPELAVEIARMQRLSDRSSEGRNSRGFNAPGTPRRVTRSVIREVPSLPPIDDDQMSQIQPAVTYDNGQVALRAFLEEDKKREMSRDQSAKSRDQSARSRDQSAKSHDPVLPDDTLNSSNAPHGAPGSSSTPTNSKKNANQLSSQQVRELVGDLNSKDLDFSISDSETDTTVVGPPGRVFMLTAMTEAEKRDFPGLVASLGGKFIPTTNFDLSCTHLLARKPSRNEKFLSAIASGCHILHHTYASDSKKQGIWLPEAEYSLENFAEEFKGKDRHMARSATKWKEKKAFADWRIILCCSESKIRNFRGIITAGGGEVVQDSPPYTVLSGITHTLIDLRSSNKHELPVSALLEAGVVCVQFDYIPEYLAHGTRDKLLQQFQITSPSQLLSSSSQKRPSSDGANQGTPKRPRN